jgi:hypothetical protein
MKAPYLTVAGKSIEKGQTYYTVLSTPPFTMREEMAHSENNIISKCYFEDKKMAETYSWMKRLNQMLVAQISEIEKNHLAQ